MEVTTQKTWKPKAAGILDIIVGIFRAIVSLLLVSVFMSCPPSQGFLTGGIAWLAAICYMVIGVLAIIGGIYSLRCKKWVWALIGSICAALSVLAIPLVVLNLNWSLYGSIFAPFDVLFRSAIVFTALSKDEFE
jgi:hypothetical protein